LKNDSFSVDVIRRILTVLSFGGSTKKTSLAGKTGLNYAAMMRYLGFLKMLQWVSYSGDSGTVSLTWLGSQFRRILVDGDDQDLQGMQKEEIDMFFRQMLHNAPSRERPAAMQKKDPSQKSSILLIDDEPDALLTYRMFLTDRGFSVEAFSDPASAMERFVQAPRKYDLVLTDIRMKPVNGLQVYQRVKMANPDAKVIFISALDAAEELVSVFPGVKAQDVIRKPIELEAFMNIVKSAISG
jgi:CheY-like chemotaxis protein